MPSPAPGVRTSCARGVARATLALLPCALPASAASAQCELDKFLPAGLEAEDRAGASVALFGDVVLVGRPGADVAGVGADAGTVAVYARLDPGWVEGAPFLAPQGAAGDRFGEAIALGDNLALVGAPGDDHGAPDAGAVYLYERVGDEWSLAARLLAPDPTPGAGFGASAAAYVSSAVVGAPGAPSAGLGGAGAVYVFEKRAGFWVLGSRVQSPAPHAGGAFGHAVALEGEIVIVGAPGEDGAAAAGPGAGAAYVVQKLPGSWSVTAELPAPAGAPGDGYGSAVATASLFAAVGAPGHDAGAIDAGFLSVFQKAGSGGWNPVKSFVSPAPAPGAGFGSRLTMFKDLLAAGAPAGGAQGAAGIGAQGAVHLYLRLPGSKWVYSLSMHASDAAERDGYGLGVSLWDDLLLVGAPDDDDAGSSSGAAYMVLPFGETAWVDLVIGGSGAPNAMLLAGSGELCGGGAVTLALQAAPPGAAVALVAGLAQLDLPFQGGLLVPRPDFIVAGLVTDGAGALAVHAAVPTGVPTALQLFVQAWVTEAGGLEGSNAVLGLTP
jgi:hypothetical protein